MSLSVNASCNDLHLHPLYLKWAAEKFSEGNTNEGMSFFGAASRQIRIWEHQVYRQLWELRGSPEGDSEYGKKAFHGLEGLSSSSPEKSQAIDKVLSTVDRDELIRREQKVHRCLWTLHGCPSGDLEYGKHAFYNMNGKRSSIANKQTAAQMYANESRVLTWLTNQEEVHLIKREDGQLEYEIIDGPSREMRRGSFHCEDPSSIDDDISYLKGCNATVYGADVCFSKPSICKEWPDPFYDDRGREIKLLKKDGRLIWRMFDKETKTASWVYANSNTIQGIEQLATLPADQQKIYREDLGINKQINGSRFLGASIVRVRWPSQLDSSKSIDKDNWAVTLISRGGGTGLCGKVIPIGHAEIIIEGVDNTGKLFKRKIHLVGDGNIIPFPLGSVPGKVSSEPINKDVIEFNQKSPTWLRRKNEIEKTIRKLNSDECKRCAFNATGYSLVGERVYNCLSWAIETLALIGITLPTSDWNVPDPYLEWLSKNPSLIRLDNN